MLERQVWVTNHLTNVAISTDDYPTVRIGLTPWETNSRGLVNLWELMNLIKPELILQTVRALWFDAALLPPADHPQHKLRLRLYKDNLKECLTLCENLCSSVSAL